MREKDGRSGGRTAALLAGSALLIAVAGCGSTGTFKNHPRPPAPVQLTGVITPSAVTISPDHVGGGPVQITVANETGQAHTLVLSRDGTEEDVVGPVNPSSTGTIQQDLSEGQYTVKADSSGTGSIQPGTITVGPKRASSSNQLLQP